LIHGRVDVPRVTDGDAHDPDWHPLQHHFGLTAFGLNVFVAREARQQLVDEQDERRSGQEEVYVVTAGRARFWLDDAARDVDAGTAVSVAGAGDAAAGRRARGRGDGARDRRGAPSQVRLDVERVALRRGADLARADVIPIVRT
jgi:hypothetical protein